MIREYQIGDHQAIVEICEEIWEGNDYLPHIINSMKDDPTCHPTVLIKDHKIISVANLRLFNKDIGWSEAIRTHTEHRGKGFASRILKHQLQFARDLGCKEIWLSTSETNHATRKMLENMGFEEKNKFYLQNLTDYKQGSIETQVEKIDKVQAEEILSKLEFPYLLGPFKVFPLESDFANGYQHNLYGIQNRTLMTLKENTERKGDLILGFNGNSEDLEEAITFAKSFNYHTIKLFTPANIDLEEYNVYRFMVYRL